MDNNEITLSDGRKITIKKLTYWEGSKIFAQQKDNAEKTLDFMALCTGLSQDEIKNLPLGDGILLSLKSTEVNGLNQQDFLQNPK